MFGIAKVRQKFDCAIFFQKKLHIFEKNLSKKSTRKQRADFDKDLLNAINALREIGLITEARIQDTAKGKRVDFRFNPDYSKDGAGDAIVIGGEMELQKEEEAKPQEGK